MMAEINLGFWQYYTVLSPAMVTVRIEWELSVGLDFSRIEEVTYKNSVLFYGTYVDNCKSLGT